MGYNIALIGSQDLIGQELLRLLVQRKFPLSRLTLLEGPTTFMAGRYLSFAGQDIPIKEISTRAFRDVDIAFFCGNSELTNQFANSVSELGVFVVDVTGAFRGDSTIPGIIPEINAAELQNLKKKRIVTSPSPAVIQLLLPLHTFRQWTSLKRVSVHSLEPISESGQAAIEMFSAEVRQVMEGNKNVVPHLYPHQIAFNILPETENVLDTGLSRSEVRVIREVRRLWKLPDLNINITSMRVPVFQGICQAVQVDFSRRVTPDEVREVLGDTPGVRLLDDPTVNLYPQPWQVLGHDEVLVGRVRTLDENHNTLAFWSVMDNLRRGGALNALKIAESAVDQKLI